MLEFSINLINGLMFGLEAVRKTEDIDEDLEWVIVFDFFVLRFQLLKWTTAE